MLYPLYYCTVFASLGLSFWREVGNTSVAKMSGESIVLINMDCATVVYATLTPQ